MVKSGKYGSGRKPKSSGEMKVVYTTFSNEYVKEKFIISERKFVFQREKIILIPVP